MLNLFVRRFFEGYLRHRWLYLLPFGILTLAAALAFVLTKPTYISKGVLYIQKESLLSSLNSIGNSTSYLWATPAQTASTEIKELLQTDSFIRAVVQNTPLEEEFTKGPQAVAETIKDTREDLWVTILGDNQIMIHASSKNPATAAQLANGVIESYVKWQSNSKVAESEAALVFFGSLITSYRDDLDAARETMRLYLEDHPEPIRGDIPGLEALEIQRLQADIDLASDRYSSALDKEENARLALSQIDSNTRQTYIVLDAPQAPLKPDVSLKQIALKYGLVAVAGFLLSVFAILGGVVLDRTFRFKVDVDNALSLPVLASIPYVMTESSLAVSEPKNKVKRKRFGRKEVLSPNREISNPSA